MKIEQVHPQAIWGLSIIAEDGRVGQFNDDRRTTQIAPLE
jgi:hypothetical protein